MATEEEVHATLLTLIDRLENIDPSYRPMLPSRRLIEAECPDLDAIFHALWNQGEITSIQEGPASRRPDIRITVNSDDLVALGRGRLDFGRAYSSDRVRIEAGVTDLLRLRAVL